ncbi:MAG: hypothetical protein ABSC93_17605 [Bryobacteraceae bacterium]
MPLISTVPKRARGKRSRPARIMFRRLTLLFLLAALAGTAAVVLQASYTFTLQSPLRIRFQWPLVIAPRISAAEAGAAQADQLGRRLTAYQQYACNKFGSACRIALAVQRAENPRGACEIYHYNSDGTLDWGYFQVNTVHLKRAGVNLRDLLDCKANIDFAYKLYTERGFEPWTTFNSGAYRQFLRTFR